MTDPAEETSKEIEVAQDETEEKRESDAYDPSTQPNSNFLSELNLLIVVLSLFSLSSEDCIDCKEQDIQSIKDDEAKATSSKYYTSRRQDREIHHTKILLRRAQRFQPMIKDSRHGRKM